VARGRKRPEGKCHICGVVGPLSWEHVPPEAAYNDHRVVRAAQEQMLSPERWDGRRGHVEQRGSGGYTLCEPCNNNTGGWYAAEYVRWARQGLERLARIPVHEEGAFFIPFRGRPLRFLKQVITMMFSANGPEFAPRHPELVKFVLDRSATGLPPEYKVDLVLVRGGFARNAGGFGMVDLSKGATEIASEVAHFPFALRLILGSTHGTRRGALEPLAQLGPDEEREVWLHTIAGHVVTKFPGDYRSRERVDREAAESSGELE
jgi:hypothetical protein